MTSYPTNINPPSEGQQDIHKTVRIGSNTLLMTIRSGVTYDLIYIGGEKVYCMYASVPKYDEYDPNEPIDMGTLNSLKYNENCAIGNKLIKEDVDVKAIVKILITYIARTYPHVKGLRFTDTSEKTCDDGTKTDLSAMVFIRTGKTWYEKNFDAYIDPEFIRVYTADMERVQQKRQTTTWEMLVRKIPSLQQMEDMRTVYESTTAWQEFFNAVYTRLGGDAQFCMFVSRWLNQFMTQYLRIRFTKYTYIMPVREYDIAFTIEPYTSGGGRHRRRRTYRTRCHRCRSHRVKQRKFDV